MDRTLAQQVAKLEAQHAQQSARLEAQNADQSAKIDRLASLMEQQLQLVAAPARAPTTPTAQAVHGSPKVANFTTQSAETITNTTNIVNIHPWDGDRRINVSVAEIAAAFAENGRLREYTGYNDHELADHKIASPNVVELLMDLVRRGHASPESRNVYLNPRRADQVLVHMKDGKWEVMELARATRLLFDGLAATIHGVAVSWGEVRALPMEAQNALSIAGMLYEERPDEYVDQAKKPMVAHLANMAPP